MKVAEFHQHLEDMFIRVWGSRCSDNEAGCCACAAWVIHDAAKSMTDSSFLDEDEDQEPGQPTTLPAD